ncbi:MAG: hypothetical protein AAGC44_04125 [Planctomycetota bacterium]
MILSLCACSDGAAQAKNEKPAIDETPIQDRIAGWVEQIHADFQLIESPSINDIAAYCNVMTLTGHTDRIEPAIDKAPIDKQDNLYNGVARTLIYIGEDDQARAMLRGDDPATLRRAVNGAQWRCFEVADHARIVDIAERFEIDQARYTGATSAAMLRQWERAAKLLESADNPERVARTEESISLLKLVETPDQPMPTLDKSTGGPSLVAMLFAVMGEPERAFQALEQSSEDEQFRGQIQVVMALDGIGQKEKAQKLWAEIEINLPPPGDDHTLMATIAQCAGRLGHVEIASAYQPVESEQIATRTKCLAAAGMMDEAFKLFQQDPKNSVAARITGETVYHGAYDQIDRLVATDTPKNRFIMLSMLVDDAVKLKVLQSR